MEKTIARKAAGKLGSGLLKRGFDEKLNAVRVTRNEKAVPEIRKLFDFRPHTSHCAASIGRD
jgi:hypothetical protein